MFQAAVHATAIEDHCLVHFLRELDDRACCRQFGMRIDQSIGREQDIDPLADRRHLLPQIGFERAFPLKDIDEAVGRLQFQDERNSAGQRVEVGKQDLRRAEPLALVRQIARDGGGSRTLLWRA